MTGIGENTLAQPVKPPLRERRAYLAKLVKNRLTLTRACPSRRFTGMSRAIPGPLRAKGTSPLGTPGRRRLSLRLRSMAPLGRHHCASAHLSRCTPAGSANASRGMQDMYSVQRNILPGRSWDVRTAPKSPPQNRATGLPAVARTSDMKVSPGLFRHPHPREPAPTRPVWQGRFPLP